MDISNLYTRGGSILPCVRQCDGVGPGPGLLCHYVYYFYYNLGVACGGGGRASMRHAHSHGHQHSRAGDLCGTAAGARQYLVSMYYVGRLIIYYVHVCSCVQLVHVL